MLLKYEKVKNRLLGVDFFIYMNRIGYTTYTRTYLVYIYIKLDIIKNTNKILNRGGNK